MLKFEQSGLSKRRSNLDELAPFRPTDAGKAVNLPERVDRLETASRYNRAELAASWSHFT